MKRNEVLCSFTSIRSNIFAKNSQCARPYILRLTRTPIHDVKYTSIRLRLRRRRMSEPLDYRTAVLQSYNLNFTGNSRTAVRNSIEVINTRMTIVGIDYYKRDFELDPSRIGCVL